MVFFSTYKKHRSGLCIYSLIELFDNLRNNTDSSNDKQGNFKYARCYVSISQY